MDESPAEARDAESAAWDAVALRAPHARTDKAARVRRMFDAIAPTYERVNQLATFGRDAAWRTRAVAALGVTGRDVVLDVACGTGDMIRMLCRSNDPPRLIIGVDFSSEMLAAGRSLIQSGKVGSSSPTSARSMENVRDADPAAHGHQAANFGLRGPRDGVWLIQADAQRLPLRDASVDAVTCAFGVRNFQDLDAGFREMRRVLRPGGRVAVLEFAEPSNRLLRWASRAYMHAVLPRLGAWIAHDRTGAYQYLPRSIETFDSPPAMRERLSRAGFASVTFQTMNFGMVVLYLARV